MMWVIFEPLKNSSFWIQKIKMLVRDIFLNGSFLTQIIDGERLKIPSPP
jgi:hypothetical protein